MKKIFVLLCITCICCSCNNELNINNNNDYTEIESYINVEDSNNYLIDIAPLEIKIPSGRFMLINESDIEYIYGDAFILERKYNDIWETVKLLDNVAFNDIGNLLPPNSSKEIEVNWKDTHEELVPGVYRIKKDFFYFNSLHKSEQLEIVLEFCL